MQNAVMVQHGTVTAVATRNCHYQASVCDLSGMAECLPGMHVMKVVGPVGAKSGSYHLCTNPELGPATSLARSAAHCSTAAAPVPKTVVWLQ